MTFTTLSDGSSTFVNEPWTEYTGLSVEQSSGTGWQRAVHPEDLARYSEKWRISVATGRLFEDEARFRRAADGEYRWFLVRGVPQLDQHANILRWYGTLTDIEDRKRAEEALQILSRDLQESKTKLEEAQKMTHTGSWAWRSADRKAVHISEEFYRIYGFDPAEGSPTWEEYFERVHPEDRLKWTGTIERAIVEKADYDQEFRILLPNGIVKWIHTVGHPVLSDAGDLEQFVGSSTDITKLKSAEQERERLRQLEADLAHTNRVSTLGEMAASLAHEIKQPIAAAITSANSCVEWLAHEPPNLDRARAAAGRIDKYGNRAAEIIDRIRSLYKKSPPQRELVDVNGIIQEMLTLLKGEATRSPITMRTELASELPKIMVDRVQLQQVFMNLMLNAIEAMNDSGGELTVKSELQDGQLQFSVRDMGVGLPAEKMDQIFSAFFTTKSQGSGMGLAISRSIVESHGGRLWATANDGRGATFHFALPTHVTESALVI
jgi:PAS domain S-box-containing protein